MREVRDSLFEIAEQKATARQKRRAAKTRRRLPVHGAGLKKIGKIWEKRLKGK